MSNNPEGIKEYTYNYIRNPRTAEDIDKMTGRPYWSRIWRCT